MGNGHKPHHLWTDEQLMAAVGTLDDLAFQALYRRHAAAALALARYMVTPEVRAEDVVQDAFLTIWRSSGRYDRTRGPVRPWLLGVVRHRAIDALRRTGSRPEHHLDPDEAIRLVASGALPESQVLRGEDARTVRRALSELPEDQRAVVELAYYQGLTHVEIAERLGAPLGTVKGRMRLALVRLRESLGGWPEVTP